MADRRPTEKQVALLHAVADGKGTAHPDFRSGTGYRVDGQAATVDVRSLVNNGWAEHDPDVGTVAEPTPQTLSLTWYGQAVLRDADDRAEYEAIPLDQRPRVTITRRRLGSRPIRGFNTPFMGRNVECSDCYLAARAEGRRADSVVWYRNESGREADREAEIALIRHTLAHTRGEIPPIQNGA
jgi:hypothetical protein